MCPGKILRSFYYHLFFLLRIEKERHVKTGTHSDPVSLLPSLPFLFSLLYFLPLGFPLLVPFNTLPLSFTVFFPTSFNLEHFSLPLSHDLFYSLFLISLLFSFISPPLSFLFLPLSPLSVSLFISLRTCISLNASLIRLMDPSWLHWLCNALLHGSSLSNSPTSCVSLTHLVPMCTTYGLTRGEGWKAGGEGPVGWGGREGMEKGSG